MGSTSIEWTSGPNGEEGYTFNPWLGCAKVHAGCTHCYAEVSQAVSMRKGGAIKWGEVWQGGQRVVVSDSTWRNPFRWAREAAAAGQRRKVFCASLADVLEVPGDPPSRLFATGAEMEPAADRAREVRAALQLARERLWDTIRKTAVVMSNGAPGTPGLVDRGFPGLDWLLLTKRPENWRLVPEDVRPLVWLGTSISNQETAAELVPRLLSSRGFRYRFLSVEPMVGPVDLTSIPGEIGHGLHSRDVLRGWNIHHDDGDQYTVEPWTKLDWVVFGFESGAKARPGHVDWIRQGLKQCQETGVAAFVKQLGADPREAYGRLEAAPMPLKDHKGRDPNEWPEDLRVRQWPNTHGRPTP
jgi:protein gp37